MIEETEAYSTCYVHKFWRGGLYCLYQWTFIWDVPRSGMYDPAYSCDEDSSSEDENPRSRRARKKRAKKRYALKDSLS
jgi:hypothetical protein